MDCSRPRHPVCADSYTLRQAWSPRCAACGLLAVREGTAIITAEGKSEPVREADLILTGAEARLHISPEERVTISGVWIHGTYLADQLSWVIPETWGDRLCAMDWLIERFPSVGVFRLGAAEYREAAVYFDKLTLLTADAATGSGFFPVQEAFSALMSVLGPYLHLSLSRRHLERMRRGRNRYWPLREEAQQIAELIRSDLSRQWLLHELAARVHLSVPQMHRVFKQSYATTPLGYLTALRVQELARLLRETGEPVLELMQQVGWSNRGTAARIFREFTGPRPSEYRRQATGRLHGFCPAC